MEASPVRLNLGCGDKILDGWINVDLADNWSGQQPDVIADVTKTLPFADNHADEIQAIHVIEHLPRWESTDILQEWIRVLKPGGLLILEMPSLDKIMRMYAHGLIDNKFPDPQITLFGLYGDPGYRDPRMQHLWCYAESEMLAIFNALGLGEIRREKPKHHRIERDFRITGRKSNGHNL